MVEWEAPWGTAGAQSRRVESLQNAAFQCSPLQVYGQFSYTRKRRHICNNIAVTVAVGGFRVESDLGENVRSDGPASTIHRPMYTWQAGDTVAHEFNRPARAQAESKHTKHERLRFKARRRAEGRATFTVLNVRGYRSGSVS